MFDRRKCAQKNGHGEKLRRRREMAIASLLAHTTILESARACGICESTMRRWLRDPEFVASYDEARQRILDAASEKLRAGTLQAALVLSAIAGDKKAPPASRVAAARSILESAGLLRGSNVTVNNIVPRTPEQARERIRQLLDEIEKKSDHENVAARPN